MSEQELKQQLAKLEEEKAKECMAKIEAILQEYGFSLQVQSQIIIVKNDNK